MDFRPIFFSEEDRHYRLHFPYLLIGFEVSMLQKDDDLTFDSSERNYMLTGFTYGNATYDIHVKEVGSDLAPGRIEAFFYTGGVKADVPADLRGMIAIRNEEATQNRTLIYLNDIRVT